MEQFNLRILSTDKVFYEGDAVSVTLPLTDGSYGVLAHHQNMISAIIPGKLKFVTTDGKEHICAVSNGLVKVEDNDVLVLAEDVEKPEDIDLLRAKTEADKAKEAILQKRSIAEFKSAQATLARAINRIKVKNDSENINNR